MASYGDRWVRVRAALVEGYGGRQVRDWAQATRESFAGAIQPASAKEDNAGRQITTTTKRLHAYPEAALLSTDRVEYGGTVYEVDGDPELQMQQGTPHHYEAILQVVTEAAT